MAKLVVLSEGLTGRSHELSTEKTTIGRVEDNSFSIVEPSISSHHCEILLRGNDVLVRDLNSTNGTFIDNEQITEGVLKPGNVLRLGKIEMRLETGAAATTAARKPIDQTVAMTRGVSLNELEQGSRPGGFDAGSKAFSKKDNKFNKIFIFGAIVLLAVIIGLLIYIYTAIKK